jgi:hypothetical protein
LDAAPVIAEDANVGWVLQLAAIVRITGDYYNLNRSCGAPEAACKRNWQAKCPELSATAV